MTASEDAPSEGTATQGEILAERACLFAGVSIALLATIALVATWALEPSSARAILAQWGAQAILGKETGIPAGLAAGSAPFVVALAGIAEDAVVLLVGYALALMLARGATRSTWIARRMPHSRTQPRRARSEIVGVPLLAMSLWIPFLPTGALVAALAGRAAGYRTRVLLPALFASIALSHAAYTTLSVLALGAIGARVLLIAAATAALAVTAGVALRRRLRDAALRSSLV